MKLGLRPLYQPSGAIYVIADVQGEAVKLHNLLEKLKTKLKPEDHVVFVGDLMDGGPDTPGVLKLVQEFIQYHTNTFILKGNHDEMFRAAVYGNNQNWWLVNGGTATMKQFEALGIMTIKDVGDWLVEHAIDFVENRLIPYYETEEILVTHAPIPTRIVENGFPVEEGFLENLDYRIRWRFEPEEDKPVKGLEGKLLVCGHQKSHTKVLVPRFYLEHNRIFVDTGAGYNPEAPLVCVRVFPLDKIETIWEPAPPY